MQNNLDVKDEEQAQQKPVSLRLNDQNVTKKRGRKEMTGGTAVRVVEAPKSCKSFLVNMRVCSQGSQIS
jgi:hypothetical protein